MLPGSQILIGAYQNVEGRHVTLGHVLHEFVKFSLKLLLAPCRLHSGRAPPVATKTTLLVLKFFFFNAVVGSPGRFGSQSRKAAEGDVSEVVPSTCTVRACPLQRAHP